MKFYSSRAWWAEIVAPYALGSGLSPKSGAEPFVLPPPPLPISRTGSPLSQREAFAGTRGQRTASNGSMRLRRGMSNAGEGAVWGVVP